jgi:hypothetical protein
MSMSDETSRPCSIAVSIADATRSGSSCSLPTKVAKLLVSSPLVSATIAMPTVPSRIAA